MDRTSTRPPSGPVRRPVRRGAVAVVLLAILTGCAGASRTPAASPTSSGAAATSIDPDIPVPDADTGAAQVCPSDTPDCDDVPAGTPGPAFPTEAVIEGAKELLGTSAATLPDGVRVVRDGDEVFTVTQDFVPGRVSVELDEVGATSEVTVVTVELPDGPRTFRQR